MEGTLGVAEDLYKAKRWLYVAFMCHQAIEKTLKACLELIDETKHLTQWIKDELSAATKPSTSSDTTSES